MYVWPQELARVVLVEVLEDALDLDDLVRVAGHALLQLGLRGDHSKGSEREREREREAAQCSKGGERETAQCYKGGENERGGTEY